MWGQWFCQGLGDRAVNKASLFLLPPALRWQGYDLKQCPGALCLLPICFAWLEKAQRTCQLGDKQGCLELGFPGHVLLFHLQPSPRRNLGTKRVFCHFQGSALHKNKLAGTHAPGKG